ncbi:hypothetical protein BX666DRAFT_2032649 [Dichotomocladium elegans]|nr:hypothetical protein BX666DRAFT_2032649 [Dichotomocladium elegans]
MAGEPWVDAQECEIRYPHHQQQGTEEKAHRLLASRTIDEFPAHRDFASIATQENFIYRLYRSCIKNRNQESEALYRYKVLRPLLELVAESASSDTELLMTPGETTLILAHQVQDNNRCDFNVDGTLRVSTLSNAELLTLEVTGAYGMKDRSRSGYDFVKGAFSCLAMLRKVAHAYYAAGFDHFSKIRMYFLHAKERKVKLWAVYTPEPGVNLMQLVKEAEVPDSFDDMHMISDLLNFWWELVIRTKSAITALEALKEEHAQTLCHAYIRNEPLPDLRLQVNGTVIDLARKDATGTPKSPKSHDDVEMSNGYVDEVYL